MVKHALKFSWLSLPSSSRGNLLGAGSSKEGSGEDLTLQETPTRIPGDLQFQKVLSNLHVGGGGGQGYVEGVHAVNHL